MAPRTGMVCRGAIVGEIFWPPMVRASRESGCLHTTPARQYAKENGESLSCERAPHSTTLSLVVWFVLGVLNGRRQLFIMPCERPSINNIAAQIQRFRKVMENEMILGKISLFLQKEELSSKTTQQPRPPVLARRSIHSLAPSHSTLHHDLCWISRPRHYGPWHGRQPDQGRPLSHRVEPNRRQM